MTDERLVAARVELSRACRLYLGGDVRDPAFWQRVEEVASAALALLDEAER